MGSRKKRSKYNKKKDTGKYYTPVTNDKRGNTNKFIKSKVKTGQDLTPL